MGSVDQLRTFLDVARQHRLGAFYRLAAFTGARRGELLHLRWSDLDFEAARFTIGGSTSTINGVRIETINGVRIEGTAKGGRSRVVSLDRATVEVMRDHRRLQLEERLAARDGGSARTTSCSARRTGSRCTQTPRPA